MNKASEDRREREVDKHREEGGKGECAKASLRAKCACYC